MTGDHCSNQRLWEGTWYRPCPIHVRSPTFPALLYPDSIDSFYTPPGTYRVQAEKEGYPVYVSPDLTVVDRPVRHNVPLGERKWDVYLPLVLRGR